MEKMVVRFVYDQLIKEINVGEGYNDSSLELSFYDQELEKEQLHSTGSRPLFGTRVPPRETKTFINIFKVVSDNFEIPSLIYQKYKLRQIYQALCLSFYRKEYQKVENIIGDDIAVKDNDSIGDENLKLLLSIIEENMDASYDIKSLDPKHLLALIKLVFKDIDDNDESQNVWQHKLKYRNQPMIPDDYLKYLSHICLRSNNDPQLIFNDYVKRYPLQSRCASVVIYLVCFCYELLLHHFPLKNTFFDTRETTN